jgi:predicted metalloprotease with PDZ domain
MPADLMVDATFAAGGSDRLQVDDEAAPFVRDVQVASGGGWVAARSLGASWVAPCRTSGCRVTYRFALREAAERLADVETAIASGEVVVSPPSSWLLRPEGPAGTFRFHVSVSPPGQFVAGTHPSADGAPDTYEASTDALNSSSFAVFGAFHRATVVSGAARVEVAIAPQGLALTDDDVVGWVRGAVGALASYFGRFPADRTLVIVQAGKGTGPTRGETLGDGGPAVLVRAGYGVRAANIRDDWVMTHELIHVALPSLSRDHVWLGEGIPSYVEPIARVRAGLLTPEKLWRDLVEGLPQGLPEAGDEGLERTHTWGRTYWGGTLFCLVADVNIRERTGNARSFDDVLRAVVATGADVEAYWTIEEMIDRGDRATGTTVLRDLYRTMGLTPSTVDLPALWRRLGVRVAGDTIAFDDTAPLAAVRRGIAQR